MNFLLEFNDHSLISQCAEGMEIIKVFKEKEYFQILYKFVDDDVEYEVAYSIKFVEAGVSFLFIEATTGMSLKSMIEGKKKAKSKNLLFEENECLKKQLDNVYKKIVEFTKTCEERFLFSSKMYKIVIEKELDNYIKGTYSVIN